MWRSGRGGAGHSVGIGRHQTPAIGRKARKRPSPRQAISQVTAAPWLKPEATRRLSSIGKRFDANYIVPMRLSADQYAQMIAADAPKWERIIRDAGIAPQ